MNKKNDMYMLENGCTIGLPLNEFSTGRLEIKPNINTVSVSVGIEKYDNPIVEIVNGEIVVKLGKVKVGGVK